MSEHFYEIYADYNQFYLRDSDEEILDPGSWSDEEYTNHLVTSPRSVTVFTQGRRFVSLIIEVRENPPGGQFDHWDRVNECSIALSGNLGVLELMGNAWKEIDVTPGEYRMRVCYGGEGQYVGPGMLVDPDAESDEVYRAIVWPSPARPPLYCPWSVEVEADEPRYSNRPLTKQQTLTVEQNSEIPSICQRWQRWLRTEEPTDQAQAVRTIEALYRFLERPVPEIVFFDNVTAAVLASRTCPGPDLAQAVDRALRVRLAAQACEQRQERFSDRLRLEVRRKLRSALHRLEDLALSALRRELNNHLKAPGSIDALGFLPQENWFADAALIDYCVSVLGYPVDTERWALYQALVSDCGLIWPHADRCIVCTRPLQVAPVDTGIAFPALFLTEPPEETVVPTLRVPSADTAQTAELLRRLYAFQYPVAASEELSIFVARQPIDLPVPPAGRVVGSIAIDRVTWEVLIEVPLTPVQVDDFYREALAADGLTPHFPFDSSRGFVGHQHRLRFTPALPGPAIDVLTRRLNAGLTEVKLHLYQMLVSAQGPRDPFALIFPRLEPPPATGIWGGGISQGSETQIVLLGEQSTQRYFWHYARQLRTADWGLLCSGPLGTDFWGVWEALDPEGHTWKIFHQAFRPPQLPSTTHLVLLAEPLTAAGTQAEQGDQWQIQFLSMNQLALPSLNLRHPAPARRVPAGSNVFRQLYSLSTTHDLLDLARYYGRQFQELGWRLVESGRNEGAAWQGWVHGDRDGLIRRVDLLTARWWSEPPSCLVWGVARIEPSA